MDSSNGFRRSIAGAWALLLSASGAVHGQDPVPGVWMRNFPPPAQTLSVSIAQVEGSFAAGAPGLGLLRQPTLDPLYVGGEGCDVEVTLVPAPTGYDLVYWITNPTDAAQLLPRLDLPGHILEPQIEYLNHRMGCSFETLVPGDDGIAQLPRTAYPATLYAPVIVVRDSRVAVGIALHYPVLEYQQQVETQVRRADDEPWWTTRFWLGGELPAGATRRYRVSVRYNLPKDWIHSLEPYRDYFRSHYGAQPGYPQDLRPVFGTAVAQSEYLAADNRRGMIDDRPDLVGWSEVVSRLLDQARAGGFQRVMIWKPSGLYYRHRQNNFPPQFMSAWTWPMVQTATQWHQFGFNGIDLSFWWGRAGQYADRWDDDELEPFEPQNPVHRAVMMSEWQLAILRGAVGAGLDAVTLMPTWKAIPWIAQLRATLPGACIVAEPVGNDVLHMLTPTLIQSRHLPDPHLLADYLVPGREMWAHLANTPEDPDHVTLARALELVSWGMTVCVRGGEIAASELEDAIARAMYENGHAPPSGGGDSFGPGGVGDP